MTSISDTTAHLIDSLQAKLAKALDEKDAVNAESREIVLGLVKFKMAKNESTESSSVSSEQPLIVKTGSL